MNTEFRDKFGVSIPLIPLKEAGQIQPGNATRVDWKAVCPNDGTEEIYLIGNPPYAGYSMQNVDQKADFTQVFGGRKFSKKLDYISLWFLKGAEYVHNSSAQLAFVSTNSITQGEQPGLLFPSLFGFNLEIGFAFTSFKWENNAKRNAGVTVVVLSLRNLSGQPKYLFTDSVKARVSNINPYLVDAETRIVEKRHLPISTVLPEMITGNRPLEGGNLIFSDDEMTTFLGQNPEAKTLVRPIQGSRESIHGIRRWCLWIKSNEEIRKAMAIPAVKERIDRVRTIRQKSPDVGARKKAETPWSFREQFESSGSTIIVPKVSSERRAFIPIDFLAREVVISDLAFAVYDAEPWVFTLLTSRMHMAWTRAVGGQLETRLRYSNTIVFNNFPVPLISEEVKEKLTLAALRVLDVREYHCERTLAELYDPDLMPTDLRSAHADVDALVDSIYSKHGFETDEQRLSDLFSLYEAMTAAETSKGKRK